MRTAVRSAVPANRAWRKKQKKKTRTVRFFGQSLFYTVLRNQKKKEARNMRGYFTAGGFYGLVDGEYRLFASEADYYEAVDTDDEAA